MCTGAIGKQIHPLLETGIKGTAIGSVAGIIALPIAKATLWGGKKVMNMAMEENNNPWKKFALKAAAIALYTIGVLATAVASVGIAVGTTVFLGGSLALAGGMVAGPYGAIAGAIVGLFAGAVAGGGIVAMAWHTVIDSASSEKEIYFRADPL